VPTEEALADKFCDFQECLWRGETEFRLVMKNWGTGPLTVARLVLLSWV